jgi:hypothetical protein
MTLPKGILAPTAQPEGSPGEAGQGGEPDDPGIAAGEAAPPEPKAPRVRKKAGKAGSAGNSKIEGRRLYLSEGVHFRLRMLAYQRGQKISEVAEDVLDKALPKWDVNRIG